MHVCMYVCMSGVRRGRKKTGGLARRHYIISTTYNKRMYRRHGDMPTSTNYNKRNKQTNAGEQLKDMIRKIISRYLCT
jgi:hypothetical protein